MALQPRLECTIIIWHLVVGSSTTPITPTHLEIQSKVGIWFLEQFSQHITSHEFNLLQTSGWINFLWCRHPIQPCLVASDTLSHKFGGSPGVLQCDEDPLEATRWIGYSITLRKRLHEDDCEVFNWAWGNGSDIIGLTLQSDRFRRPRKRCIPLELYLKKELCNKTCAISHTKSGHHY